MNFGLSESQRILKENARKFFVNECPMSEVRRILETDHSFDAALYRKMAEQGFTGIIFPERYGGLGLGKVEMALLLEEMGWVLVPGPYFSSVLMAGTVIDAAASEAWIARGLPGMNSPVKPPGDRRYQLRYLGARTVWLSEIFPPCAASLD